MPQKIQRTREEEFQADSPMSDFMDRKLAPQTRHQYIIKLKIFFKSLGLQGSLDQQSREFLTKARSDKEWAQNGLKYFIRDKKQKAEVGQIAESTIRNFYKPVRFFCDVHELELSWKKITDMIPTGNKFADDRAPTSEEIQIIIEYPDRRIKPIVLVTCASGIRVGAWEYLRWKHIEPINKDNKIIAAKIIVYAGDNERYISFITPEAFGALQEWMDYRKQSGENINGDSWLMRTLWDTISPHSSTINSPSRMTTKAIRSLMERALKSQGLRKGLDLKVTRRYEFKANHGFRKFFQTNAERNMKSLHVKTLMRQNTGLANSYYKPTTQELLEEYLKAVDNLTINKEADSQQQHEEMIRNQQALAVEIRTKDQEIYELKQQMAQSKQEIKDQFQAYEAKMNEFVHDIQSRLNQEEVSRPYTNFMLDKMREILDRTAPGWFQEVHGPRASRLTPKAKQKIEELRKILTPKIDAENRQRDLELQKQRKILVKTLNDSRA